MSERITWTTCPHCGGSAAVGWLQDDPIEFDCTAGCTVTDLRPFRWGAGFVTWSAEEHARSMK